MQVQRHNYFLFFPKCGSNLFRCVRAYNVNIIIQSAAEKAYCARCNCWGIIVTSFGKCALGILSNFADFGADSWPGFHFDPYEYEYTIKRLDLCETQTCVLRNLMMWCTWGQLMTNQESSDWLFMDVEHRAIVFLRYWFCYHFRSLVSLLIDVLTRSPDLNLSWLFCGIVGGINSAICVYSGYLLWSAFFSNNEF